MTRRAYIETYGCQMNVADSELIVGILADAGFVVTTDIEQADLFLLNTCAVREKAEERIFGRLGWAKPIKTRRPELIVGVVGCMAEHLRDAIIARAPHVDLIAGPDAYRRLPELIEQARRADEDAARIDVRLDRGELYEGLPIKRAAGVSGYITIMRGCDKFCSFCVVPYVRGRERSVPATEVVRQARLMAEDGHGEVVLLGQTVSSYAHQGTDFLALLQQLQAIDGLRRIRFTAPYPSDFTPELLAGLRSLSKVERHLHLPLQSGSTPILKAMNRKYTAEQYRELTRHIREQLPEFSITTDLIVGYPGEREEDFAATLALSAEVGFDYAYMFMYSERSMTRAARSFPDDVPLEVKKDRLQRLIALQEKNSARRNAEMVGRQVEVLVEGENPRPVPADHARGQDPRARQVVGRTSCFKTMVLFGDHQPGELVTASVSSASTHTLYGGAATTGGINDEQHQGAADG